ncbi:hypothetical protein [Hyphomicrobium sp.]|uniref:hypothetical protein n=1 Tax=Hyphomicrobium sp. TaxID=82 RepID=UPI002FE083E1
MARRSTDGRNRSGPDAPSARKPAPTLAGLTVTIPEALSDKAASFLGSDVANDPAFWMIALSTGIEELERQLREIEADARREAEEAGYVIIFGAPTIIGPSESDDDDDPDGDDPEGIPF